MDGTAEPAGLQYCYLVLRHVLLGKVTVGGLVYGWRSYKPWVGGWLIIGWLELLDVCNMDLQSWMYA